MSWEVVAQGLLSSTLAWFLWQVWTPAKGGGAQPWTKRLDPSAKQLLSSLSITAVVFLWPNAGGRPNMTVILYQLLAAPEQPGAVSAEDVYTAPTMTAPLGRNGESIDHQLWTPLEGG